MTDAAFTIRLHKFLAERGLGSRRRCEQYIADGRVAVNGKTVAVQGARIVPAHDTVTFDGKPIEKDKPTSRTIMLYKPRGYICSASPRQGRTVYDLIKGINERLVPVGRLDKDSEGLLLMSNDGDLVQRLTHPRFDPEKTYRVTVSGKVDGETLRKLRSRLVIDGYRIQPARARMLKDGGNPERHIIEFALKEGRNRQIRKMCEAAQLKIHRLVRVRIKGLALSALTPGRWRDLSDREVAELYPASAGCFGIFNLAGSTTHQ